LFLSFASTVPQKETEQAGTVCPYGDIMVVAERPINK